MAVDLERGGSRERSEPQGERRGRHRVDLEAAVLSRDGAVRASVEHYSDTVEGQVCAAARPMQGQQGLAWRRVSWEDKGE